MRNAQRQWLCVPLAAAAVIITGTTASAGNGKGKEKEEQEIPFEEARLFFELNDTDGDLGFHGLIDGDEWKTSEGAGPLLIELTQGSHEVEVRKEGFTTYRATVQVRGAETVALNVSLAR